MTQELWLKLDEDSIKIIMFWLSKDARRKWASNSSKKEIEQLYNLMNSWLPNPVAPKKWEWKE